jgi:hypothetical protein
MDTQTHYRSSLVLVGFLIVAGFFLVTEHRAHFFGILPFLLLLACPLLHHFMHGSHGGHDGRGGNNPRSDPHAGHRMPEERTP